MTKITIPVQMHPFDRTKADFVLRGAAAELVVLINAGWKGGVEHPSLQNRVENWIHMYKDEGNKDLASLVQFSKRATSRDGMDYEELKNVAESFLK